MVCIWYGHCRSVGGVNLRGVPNANHSRWFKSLPWRLALLRSIKEKHASFRKPEWCLCFRNGGKGATNEACFLRFETFRKEILHINDFVVSKHLFNNLDNPQAPRPAAVGVSRGWKRCFLCKSPPKMLARHHEGSYPTSHRPGKGTDFPGKTLPFPCKVGPKWSNYKEGAHNSTDIGVK